MLDNLRQRLSLAARDRKDWIGKRTRAEHSSMAACSADVLMVSGCQDKQTSADAWEAGGYTGALTYAFLRHVERCETASPLLQDVSVWLRLNSNAQRPVMSFGSEQAERNFTERLILFSA